MAEENHDFIKIARNWVRRMDEIFQNYPDDSLLASIDQFFQNRQIPTFIKNSEKEWIATFQLPGVEKDRIKMRVLDNQLVVVVTEKKQQELKDDQKDIYQFKQYQRSRESTITLPGNVIPSTLTASFEQGLLKVKAKKQVIDKRDLLID